MRARHGPAAGPPSPTEASLDRAQHVPERSCFACGRHAPKRELMRVVRAAGGSIEVDPTGKVSGRGTYLCLSRKCWEEGLKKTRLDRVLRCNVSREARDRLLAYSREELLPSTLGEG